MVWIEVFDTRVYTYYPQTVPTNGIKIKNYTKELSGIRGITPTKYLRSMGVWKIIWLIILC